MAREDRTGRGPHPLVASASAPTQATTPEDRTGRGPHPLVAAALSAVWPGLGHLGHRNRRGLLLAAATLVAAALGLAYLLTRRASTLLTWSVTRPSLLALIAATVCALVFRGAVAVDAFGTARRRSPPRPGGVLRRLGTVATLLLLGLFIAAPHVIVIRLAATQLTLLSDVFVATDTQTARPTPLPTTAETTDAPDDSDGTTATGDPTSTATTDTGTATTDAATTDAAPTDAATTDAATTDAGDSTGDAANNPATTDAAATTAPADGPPPADPAPAATARTATWDGADRLTIALLGSDGGYQRSGVRTDTIIVLSIDVATGDAAAFNVPRNWTHVTFPGRTAAAERWPDGYPGIANEIYALGLQHPAAFPGVEDKAGHAIKSALAQLTGLEIQYYVMADMVGFVKVIDLFGGIEVHVRESVEDRIAPIAADGRHIVVNLGPGYHRLDGLTALGYVRSRVNRSDYHRMTRQRCVVGALIDQVTPLEALARYVTLADIISEHARTDIPLDRLGDLIAEADRLDTSRIVTVNFIPPEYPSREASIARVREAVAQALEGSDNEANTALADACRGPA